MIKPKQKTLAGANLQKSQRRVTNNWGAFIYGHGTNGSYRSDSSLLWHVKKRRVDSATSWRYWVRSHGERMKLALSHLRSTDSCAPASLSSINLLLQSNIQHPMLIQYFPRYLSGCMILYWDTQIRCNISLVLKFQCYK